MAEERPSWLGRRQRDTACTTLATVRTSRSGSSYTNFKVNNKLENVVIQTQSLFYGARNTFQKLLLICLETGTLSIIDLKFNERE